MNDLKHIVNTAINVARLVYYRNQWENVRGVEYSCFQLFLVQALNLEKPSYFHISNDLKHIVNTSLNVARLVYNIHHGKTSGGLNTSASNCSVFVGLDK